MKIVAFGKAFPAVLAGCLGMASLMNAQDEVQFSKWMKDTGTESDVLRKMQSKTGTDAVKSAEKLVALYGHMKGFWDQRKVADAVKWSNDGIAAAEELLASAKSGDADKASLAFRNLSGTCKSCHTVHREKLPDGTYKIK